MEAEMFDEERELPGRHRLIPVILLVVVIVLLLVEPAPAMVMAG